MTLLVGGSEVLDEVLLPSLPVLEAESAAPSEKHENPKKLISPVAHTQVQVQEYKSAKSARVQECKKDERLQAITHSLTHSLAHIITYTTRTKKYIQWMNRRSNSGRFIGPINLSLSVIISI
jgi:hypothetical protein